LAAATKGQLAIADTVLLRQARTQPVIDYTNRLERNLSRVIQPVAETYTATYTMPDVTPYLQQHYPTRQLDIPKKARKMHISKTTLVVVPPKLIPHWESELKKHLKNPVDMSRKTKGAGEKARYAERTATNEAIEDEDEENGLRYRIFDGARRFLKSTDVAELCVLGSFPCPY
jgi:hypothetical protein